MLKMTFVAVSHELNKSDVFAWVESRRLVAKMWCSYPQWMWNGPITILVYWAEQTVKKRSESNVVAKQKEAKLKERLMRVIVRGANITVGVISAVGEL